MGLLTEGTTKVMGEFAPEVFSLHGLSAYLPSGQWIMGSGWSSKTHFCQIIWYFQFSDNSANILIYIRTQSITSTSLYGIPLQYYSNVFEDRNFHPAFGWHQGPILLLLSILTSSSSSSSYQHHHIIIIIFIIIISSSIIIISIIAMIIITIIIMVIIIHKVILQILKLCDIPKCLKYR